MRLVILRRAWYHVKSLSDCAYTLETLVSSSILMFALEIICLVGFFISQQQLMWLIFLLAAFCRMKNIFYKMQPPRLEFTAFSTYKAIFLSVRNSREASRVCCFLTYPFLSTVWGTDTDHDSINLFFSKVSCHGIESISVPRLVFYLHILKAHVPLSVWNNLRFLRLGVCYSHHVCFWTLYVYAENKSQK